MARTLPPGVSEQAFAGALAAFVEIVGEKWVISDEIELQAFNDPYPVGEYVAAGPSAVVSPATAEEVQAIVRATNRFGVPMSPVSTGKNNGYGGASPRLSGAVVVNLGAQMNKILEVNEKYGYALVEPGVTLLRSLQVPPGHRQHADARLSRSRLGQRGRQHHGSRRRLHALRRSLHVADRDGGRAARPAR